jgi:PAS domain S-box-containing protein
MMLRRRTWIGVGSSLIVLMSILLLVVSGVALYQLKRVEQQVGQRSVHCALEALSGRITELDAVVLDWAEWDDSYAFIQNLAPRYTRSNLTDAIFTDLRIGFVAFARPDGSLACGLSYDSSTGHAGPLPPFLRQALRPGSPLLKCHTPADKVSGFVCTPNGLMLVAARPITDSSGHGPVRGVLVMGRYLDHAEQTMIARCTSTDISIYPVSDRRFPDDVAKVYRALFRGDRPVRPLDASIASYVGLFDVDAQPVAILRTLTPRLTYAQARASLRILIISLLIIGGVFGLIAVLLLERHILSRVVTLSEQIATIEAGGDLSARVSVTAERDEISSLATNINGMLAAVERAQRWRAEHEERYRAVVTQVQDGICLIDLETRTLIEANRALHEALDYEPEELVGRRVDNLVEGDSEDVKRSMDKVLYRVPGRHMEGQLRAKDGSLVDVEATLTIIAYNDREVICAVVRDVTQKKRAEREHLRTQEERRQAQRLQAIGQLAAGIAHNFNNLLTVIIGGIQLSRMTGPDASARHLSNAENAAVLASETIRRFSRFNRSTPVELAPLDLQAVVVEIAGICRSTFDRRIEIRTTHTGRPPTVRGDHSQIHEVLLNLCINARDALEASVDSGRPPAIEIGVEVVNVADRQAAQHGAKAGEYVRLSVRDNGIGMDADTRAHVFEPFFTTKQLGHGTGLGLSTAYGTMAQHGGWITCDSVPGEGTTFEAYLPAMQEESVAGAAAAEEIVGGTETILVIDDEEPIRSVAMDALTAHGYEVLVAEDGLSGLQILERDKDRIGVVLLDLSMPRLSGADVKARILELAPQTRIIISSGYPPTDATNVGARAFLAKPFTVASLLQTVRSVLDE